MFGALANVDVFYVIQVTLLNQVVGSNYHYQNLRFVRQLIPLNFASIPLNFTGFYMITASVMKELNKFCKYKYR